MSYRYYDPICAFTKEKLTIERKRELHLQKCIKLMFDENTKIL